MKSIMILLLMGLAGCLPSEYDLRSQPSLLKFADYSLQPEGVCAGYAWAKQLTQIVSNAISLKTPTKLRLSAQHLLECTQTLDDKCYKSTLSDITRAMDFITNQGITTEACYPNRPLSFPNQLCSRFCQNSKPIDNQFRAEFKQLESIEYIWSSYKNNENITIFAILKVDQSFNFYSSFNDKLSTIISDDSVFEYRVAEVLGWRNKQSKLILRAGPGEGWGFEGYMDLQLSKYGHYVHSYYYVDLSDQANTNKLANIRVDQYTS